MLGELEMCSAQDVRCCGNNISSTKLVNKMMKHFGMSINQNLKEPGVGSQQDPCSAC